MRTILTRSIFNFRYPNIIQRAMSSTSTSTSTPSFPEPTEARKQELITIITTLYNKFNPLIQSQFGGCF